MGVELKKGRLALTRGTLILPLNQRRIEELNSGTFFTNPSMNRWGREFTHYLCNPDYEGLQNPEVLDLSKNTLSKVLTRLRVIDQFVRKPLEQYTMKDFARFESAFLEGRIKEFDKSNKLFKRDTLRFYVREFKRFYRCYRQWLVQYDPHVKLVALEWGLNLKAPRSHGRTYEQFPYLNVEQVVQLADGMAKKEYAVRVLMSVNLMGRKCELTALRRKDIEERPGGQLWVQLPHVKKCSSEKVPVELYTYVKRELVPYLAQNKFRDDDPIFPSREEAFAKNLREVSHRLFKQRINPKTLRKLGVCIAEQNGYQREDVERIGGWQANSPVLAHYFKRKGVSVRADADKNIEKEQHGDLYVEIDKLRGTNRELRTELEQFKMQFFSLLIRSGEADKIHDAYMNAANETNENK
jgi:integrase